MVWRLEMTARGPINTIHRVDESIDDVARIRRVCGTCRVRWLITVYRSLAAAGWSRHCLAQLHATPGDVWYRLIVRDCRPFDAPELLELIRVAAGDPARWRQLAFRTLAARGWSTRTIATAWNCSFSSVALTLRQPLEVAS